MIISCWERKEDSLAGLAPDYQVPMDGSLVKVFRTANQFCGHFGTVEVSETESDEYVIGRNEVSEWIHAPRQWVISKIPDEQRPKVLENLLNGVLYQGIDVYGRGVGVVFYDSINKVLRWNRFGSSAEDATLEGLSYVIDYVPFADCIDFVPCHWSDYHCNYIPDDPQYEGVDVSRSHPNVCGL